MSGQLILPIGQDLGVAGAGTHQIRIGPRIVELTDERYTVWLLAHGTPQAVDTATTWHRESVAAVAGLAGLRDVDVALGALLADGLLAEVVPTAGEEFARGHRLVPTVLGVGNRPDEPMLHGIGFPGTVVLEVDLPTYDLWAWSAVEDSLLDTCRSAADVARRADDLGHQSADKLLTDFLRCLHPLLLTRVAYLDVPMRLARPDDLS